MRAQDALTFSPTTDGALFELSLDLCMLVDDGLHVARVNSTAAGVLGYEPAELAGRPVLDLVHADDRQRASVDFEAAAAADSPRSFEHRWRHRDGHHVWLLWRAQRSSQGCVIACGRDISHSREAEDRLLAAEERYRVLVDEMDVGLLACDRDLRIVHANTRAAEILGVPSDQLRGRCVDDAGWETLREDGSPMPPEERLGVVAARTGRPQQAVVGLRTASGRIRWLKGSARPFRRSPHAPDNLVVMSFSDVSELKAAERERREAEALFRAAFEHAPVGMSLGTLDGRLLRVNAAQCRIAGRRPEELVGSQFDSICHPDDREASRQALERLVAGEAPVVALEKRYVRPDGREKWTQTSLSLIHDETGQPVGFVSQVQDIDERKRAQAALRESEQRLQGIVDNTASAIYVKELDGRYSLVNHMAVDFLGLPRERVVGHRDRDFLPDHVADALAANDAAVLEAGRPLQFEERFSGPSGERTVMTAKFPLVGPDGAAYAVCGISTDITERVRQEQERTQLEARLHQSQRLESLGLLAGGIAHDFNNLLAVIGNNAAFAVRGLPEGAPGREELEEIEAAAERASRLIEQLLLFSRREVVEIETLDLRAVIRDLEGLLRRTLGEDVAMVIEDEKAPALTRADRGQVEQVLVNLAVNARDALPDGGTIRVAATPVELNARELAVRPDLVPGPYVRLSVADTGSGMSEETARRAFEPFFTTKGPGQGTGLGLATVWGIATRAGGHVDIDTGLGEGTKVSVYLPAAQAPAAAADTCDGGRRCDGEGRTVLVVEDDAAVSRVTRRLLAGAGYEVLEAGDGETALAVCREHAGDVDLLVTDVIMPGMSGKALAGRLRQLRPGLPVVYVSGHAPEVVGRRGVDASSVVLSKPFNGDGLLRAVDQALQGAVA